MAFIVTIIYDKFWLRKDDVLKYKLILFYS